RHAPGDAGAGSATSLLVLRLSPLILDNAVQDHVSLTLPYEKTGREVGMVTTTALGSGAGQPRPREASLLAIQVSGLKKSFGATAALDSVDLAVAAGSVYSIL